ncbi:MAG TPA: quinone oxidoreductase [Devosia sp.]|nr:quinone oxidoreductase [Devosia sp.]
MSRAIVVHEFGGPEVLKLEERQVGAPGPGEIKVRHTAIGLNYSDVYNRTGLYPLPRPFVPGGEGTGVVTAVGPDVRDFKEGDRIGYIGPPGAYADERLMPAARAFTVPDSISDETAAAAMLKGLTVYYLIFETHRVTKDDTILWHAAAGGVGLIATQWAKALGATVIGTAGSDEKLELCRANGCDAVINYKTEDFPKRVRELTGGRGVDVVYDGVGKVTFEPSLDCLRPRGLMVSFGNASGYVTIPNLGILSTKGSLYVTRPTTATYFAKTEDLRRAAKALFEVIADGTVKIAINQRFKLEDVQDAHRALEARETTGSTVILP